MTISLPQFLSHLLSDPVLAVTVVLTLGVILVNGWTDAPNAIATCISTRSMSPDAAIFMAAAFNFFGVFVMTSVNAKVAATICNMVDFGDNSSDALIALCASLFAIVIWATAAWWFGIPTSESHALIAGLSGAAIALHGVLEGINGSEWIKVLYGLLLSTVPGFAFGWCTVKFIEWICKGMDRRKTIGFFKSGQITGGAAMAFMHGAQDGQKFMGIFLLGIFLTNGQTDVNHFRIPLWLMLLCSVTMALGTSIGGCRIIKAVGMDMVKLDTYQGFAADLAGAGCLFLSSIAGFPVSTTHAKAAAVMGVGAARRISNVNWNIAKEMALTWILTFPGCGLIGFLTAKLFMWLFK